MRSVLCARFGSTARPAAAVVPPIVLVLLVVTVVMLVRSLSTRRATPVSRSQRTLDLEEKGTLQNGVRGHSEAHPKDHFEDHSEDYARPCIKDHSLDHGLDHGQTQIQTLIQGADNPQGCHRIAVPGRREPVRACFFQEGLKSCTAPTISREDLYRQLSQFSWPSPDQPSSRSKARRSRRCRRDSGVSRCSNIAASDSDEVVNLPWFRIHHSPPAPPPGYPSLVAVGGHFGRLDAHWDEADARLRELVILDGAENALDGVGVSK